MEHIAPEYPNLQSHIPFGTQDPPFEQFNDPPLLQPKSKSIRKWYFKYF